MCDYSLHLIASRPARVGDKLISTSFPHTMTRGFASVDDRSTAVCLLPGTELAFEKEIDARLACSCPGGSDTSWRSFDKSTRAGQTSIMMPLSSPTEKPSC